MGTGKTKEVRREREGERERGREGGREGERERGREGGRREGWETRDNGRVESGHYNRLSFFTQFSQPLTIKSVVETVLTGALVACRISLKQRPISFFGCRETAQISRKERGTSSMRQAR